MQKNKKALIIVLICVLVVCIALMFVALLVSEKSFAEISAYIAIACVVLALVGVVIIIRTNSKAKQSEIERQIRETEQKIKELSSQ